MIRKLPAGALALLMAACGTGGPQAADGPVAASPERAPAPVAPDPAGARGAGDATRDDPGGAAPVPRIAYAYTLQFRLPAGRLVAALDAHVALCDRLGPARCRVVSLSRSGEEGQFQSASLQLQVAADEARAFADRMEAGVAAAGGRTIARGQQAEDLGRQIVDVEARIAAKAQLADRLRALISRPGAKVGELVEAERAFAEAQAELDSARSQLEIMQRQVAMSRIDAGYQSSAPEGSGALAPVRAAVAEAGQMLGGSVAAVIRFVIVALPWALLVGLVVVGIRRLLQRRGRLPPPAPPA